MTRIYKYFVMQQQAHSIANDWNRGPSVPPWDPIWGEAFIPKNLKRWGSSIRCIPIRRLCNASEDSANNDVPPVYFSCTLSDSIYKEEPYSVMRIVANLYRAIHELPVKVQDTLRTDGVAFVFNKNSIFNGFCWGRARLIELNSEPWYWFGETEARDLAPAKHAVSVLHEEIRHYLAHRSGFDSSTRWVSAARDELKQKNVARENLMLEERDSNRFWGKGKNLLRDYPPKRRPAEFLVDILACRDHLKRYSGGTLSEENVNLLISAFPTTYYFALSFEQQVGWL